jgi:uncharacterized protein (DUF1697 family)
VRDQLHSWSRTEVISPVASTSVAAAVAVRAEARPAAWVRPGAAAKIAGMARYAAFLRGVSPMNLRMPALKACFETAGLSEVHTLLSSGNVIFRARSASVSSLERRIEAVMQEQLGQVFMTIVRSEEQLRVLLGSDPYRAFGLAGDAKRIVTFMRTVPASVPKLPVELEGARLLCVRGAEVLGAYRPCPRGPVFMTLIEKTLGKDVTTRTWETVRKVREGLQETAGGARSRR